MAAKKKSEWKMDRWKFYAITHASHTIMNPLSQSKLDALTGHLPGGTGASYLDMGCGKGRLLIDLAAKGKFAHGLGIDASPFEVHEAESSLAGLGQLPVEFLLMDGAKYTPPAGRTFDATICLGATWILGGYEGTLRAFSKWTRPAGTILIGQPFWKKRPPAAYLVAAGEKYADYGTHPWNVSAAQRLGLELRFFLESSKSDWDTYEGLQWSAALHWADANPGDPDVDEVLRRIRRSRDAYLRWGRDCLGWAAYVFRNAGKARAPGEKS
jgi:SAM-dependent methyltransferase